jgi:hypothetical protein
MKYWTENNVAVSLYFICESTSYVEDLSYITRVLSIAIIHTFHTSHYIKLHVLQRYIT